MTKLQSRTQPHHCATNAARCTPCEGPTAWPPGIATTAVLRAGVTVTLCGAVLDRGVMVMGTVAVVAAVGAASVTTVALVGGVADASGVGMSELVAVVVTVVVAGEDRLAGGRTWIPVPKTPA